MMRAGLGVAAGTAGLAAAARIAGQYGLVPPDCGGLYGPGHTLTYAAQRVLTVNSMAKEFPREKISAAPHANGRVPKDEKFVQMQAAGFADWRVSIDGMVAKPGSFSLADLKNFERSTQVTALACEEGWSYVAEWVGVPLFQVLNAAGILPEAKYVVYFSYQKSWDGSIDMADALHPQTLLAYGMNGADMPAPFGGPVRIRVPRQLGYKSVKYINRLTVTDDLTPFSQVGSYSWYAGI